MSILKHALAAAAFTIVATAGSAQAQTPNMSGQWEMNAAKSNFGPIPAPPKLTMSIEQGPAVFKFSQVVTTPAGDQSVVQTIPIGAADTTWTAGDGGPVTSHTAWDGNTLVVTAKLQRQGADITQLGKWSLSPDGKVLTLVQQSTTPMGAFTFTIVCDKKN